MNKVQKTILFVLATPIGNIEDITLRGLRALKEADSILSEDTRSASKLLTLYEIPKKPLHTLHQHTDPKYFHTLCKEIVLHKSTVLITDAGTPNISDPGGAFLHFVFSEYPEITIVPLPGPSAITALLSVSGINVQEFSFFGFIPHKKGRQTFLRKIAFFDQPVVFFESCHRILKCLEEYKVILESEGASNVYLVVGRELTKMFETVYRGSINDVLEMIKKDPQKGEYVLLASQIPKTLNK